MRAKAPVKACDSSKSESKSAWERFGSPDAVSCRLTQTRWWWGLCFTAGAQAQVTLELACGAPASWREGTQCC